MEHKPHSVLDPERIIRRAVSEIDTNCHAPDDKWHAELSPCPACEVMDGLQGLLEQLETLRGELQHAWEILSVEGYADDPDWAGTRSIKDALDASNPAKERL